MPFLKSNKNNGETGIFLINLVAANVLINAVGQRERSSVSVGVRDCITIFNQAGTLEGCSAGSH